jgi:hypothetical protein
MKMNQSQLFNTINDFFFGRKFVSKFGVHMGNQSFFFLFTYHGPNAFKQSAKTVYENKNRKMGSNY